MRILIAIISAVVLSLTAESQTRRAFIVGVQNYDELTDLTKTISDAEGYAEVFGRLGFEVTQLLDPTYFEFVDAIAEFTLSVDEGDEVAFIFSGHGWSDGARNYLVMRDAPLRSTEQALKRRTFDLNSVVLDELRDRKPRLALAVIDACRDNPFDLGTKSVTKGLVPQQTLPGTMVVYAAGAEQQALDRLQPDDPSPYSVFTRTLLPKLRDGTKPIARAFDEARDETSRLAMQIDHAQRPAIYSDLSLDYCFAVSCQVVGQEALETADDQLATTFAARALNLLDDDLYNAALWAVASVKKSPERSNEAYSAIIQVLKKLERRDPLLELLSLKRPIRWLDYAPNRQTAIICDGNDRLVFIDFERGGLTSSTDTDCLPGQMEFSSDEQALIFRNWSKTFGVLSNSTEMRLVENSRPVGGGPFSLAVSIDGLRSIEVGSLTDGKSTAGVFDRLSGNWLRRLDEDYVWSIELGIDLNGQENPFLIAEGKIKTTTIERLALNQARQELGAKFSYTAWRDPFSNSQTSQRYWHNRIDRSSRCELINKELPNFSRSFPCADGFRGRQYRVSEDARFILASSFEKREDDDILPIWQLWEWSDQQYKIATEIPRDSRNDDFLPIFSPDGGLIVSHQAEPSEVNQFAQGNGINQNVLPSVHRLPAAGELKRMHLLQDQETYLIEFRTKKPVLWNFRLGLFEFGDAACRGFQGEQSVPAEEDYERFVLIGSCVWKYVIGTDANRPSLREQLRIVAKDGSIVLGLITTPYGTGTDAIIRTNDGQIGRVQYSKRAPCNRAEISSLVIGSNSECNVGGEWASFRIDSNGNLRVSGKYHPAHGLGITELIDSEWANFDHGKPYGTDWRLTKIRFHDADKICERWSKRGYADLQVARDLRSGSSASLNDLVDCRLHVASDGRLLSLSTDEGFQLFDSGRQSLGEYDGNAIVDEGPSFEDFFLVTSSAYATDSAILFGYKYPDQSTFELRSEFERTTAILQIDYHDGKASYIEDTALGEDWRGARIEGNPAFALFSDSDEFRIYDPSDRRFIFQSNGEFLALNKNSRAVAYNIEGRLLVEFLDGNVGQLKNWPHAHSFVFLGDSDLALINRQTFVNWRRGVHLGQLDKELTGGNYSYDERFKLLISKGEWIENLRFDQVESYLFSAKLAAAQVCSKYLVFGSSIDPSSLRSDDPLSTTVVEHPEIFEDVCS